jgi:hypothetical protein
MQPARRDKEECDDEGVAEGEREDEGDHRSAARQRLRLAEPPAEDGIFALDQRQLDHQRAGDHCAQQDKAPHRGGIGP